MGEITHLVDTSAMIAYFKEESGHNKFAELLADSETILAMHLMNLGELYHIYNRVDGAAEAECAWAKAMACIRVVDIFDESFIKRVSRWKATLSDHHPRNESSWCDAFAAAAAEHYAVSLVTTDHGDFDPIEQAGLLQIEWLR
jgi:predicted nucleic acid-binding protein